MRLLGNLTLGKIVGGCVFKCPTAHSIKTTVNGEWRRNEDLIPTCTGRSLKINVERTALLRLCYKCPRASKLIGGINTIKIAIQYVMICYSPRSGNKLNTVYFTLIISVLHFVTSSVRRNWQPKEVYLGEVIPKYYFWRKTLPLLYTVIVTL